MSRSRKHTPIRNIAADSNGTWKRRANRRHRGTVRAALRRGDEVLPALREVANLYDSPGDGKRWQLGRAWSDPDWRRK